MTSKLLLSLGASVAIAATAFCQSTLSTKDPITVNFSIHANGPVQRFNECDAGTPITIPQNGIIMINLPNYSLSRASLEWHPEGLLVSANAASETPDHVLKLALANTTDYFAYSNVEHSFHRRFFFTALNPGTTTLTFQQDPQGDGDFAKLKQDHGAPRITYTITVLPADNTSAAQNSAQ